MLNVKPNLKGIMTEKGINQMALSKLSGVPQGTISRFDKNTRHDDWHLFSIAKALDVPIEKLFIVIEE